MGKLIIRTITVGRIEADKTVANVLIREGSQNVAQFDCPITCLGQIIEVNL